jgi:hypothetical protein
MGRTINRHVKLCEGCDQRMKARQEPLDLTYTKHWSARAIRYIGEGKWKE